MNSFNCWCIGQDESFAVLSSLDKTINDCPRSQPPKIFSSPSKIKCRVSSAGLVSLRCVSWESAIKAQGKQHSFRFNHAYLLTVLLSSLKFQKVYQKEASALQEWLQNVKNSCIASPWCGVTKWSIDQEQDVSYACQTHSPPSAAAIPLFGIERIKCPVLNGRSYHNFGPQSAFSILHLIFSRLRSRSLPRTQRTSLSICWDIFYGEERVDSINHPLSELLGQAFRMNEAPGVKSDTPGVWQIRCISCLQRYNRDGSLRSVLPRQFSLS